MADDVVMSFRNAGFMSVLYQKWKEEKRKVKTKRILLLYKVYP
jgi:hypothetical protein